MASSHSIRQNRTSIPSDRARPDMRFYALPRLVTHIGDATIAALHGPCRECLPAGGDMLNC